MNPSSHSRHRQTTRLVIGAGHCQHRIEAQTGWGIEKFVRDTRCYRIVTIKADSQTRTAAGPLPDDLRNALIKIRAEVRSNLSQVGTNPTLLAGWDGPRDVVVVIVDLREHGVVALRQ